MGARFTSPISTYMLRIYSLLAVLVLGIFGVSRLIAEPFGLLGILELIGSIVLLLNVTSTRLARKATYAKNSLLSVMLFFLGIMLVTGGTHNAGILWCFVFPASAFFLTGRQEGMKWMGALFVLIASIWTLEALSAINIPYDSLTLAQLVASLAVVTIGVYVYQLSRERLVNQTRESQEALQNEKLRADIIVQSLTEGIITTDADGTVVFINRAAEKMLGWDKNELVGKPFVEKVPMLTTTGTIIPPTERPLYQSLQSNKAIDARVIYRRKDGKHLPIALTETPIAVKGKVVGSIGTLRDIRDEENMMRAKSEFVTLASHQLRTPISAISWMSELLLGGDAGTLSTEQQKYISDIYRSNQRMAALVGEMLIVSSLDLQSLPVNPEKADLVELATAVVKEYSHLLEHKKQTLDERYAATLPKLYCDPEIVKLILRNLLSNAHKYTPSGGRITLTIAVDHGLTLQHDSKGSVVMTITDTGYGIPHEAQNKIFTKFFRAENITNKDTDGTGLGLYVVKALLTYVGGSTSFTSQEGKGTTFKVVLPLEGMKKHDVKDSKDIRTALQVERKKAHV
jgi:PAS domain S-box-containing protein